MLRALGRLRSLPAAHNSLTQRSIRWFRVRRGQSAQSAQQELDAMAASRLAYLQVLGTDTGDTTPSCFLFTHRQRYLFNVGENTQRFCLEYKLRPTKLNHVFLSDITPEASAGLAGMLLTVADAGATELTVHGPRDVEKFLHATRHFMIRTQFKLTVKEHDNAADGSEPAPFQDEDAAIHPVVIRAKAEAHSPSREPVAKKARSAGSVPLPPTLAYVIKLADTPGKFDKEKAVKLGIKPGPKYAALTRGESVMSDADPTREVKPSEVIGATTPGPTAVVLRCPSAHYVDGLVSHPAFAECFAKGGARVPSVIIHMTEQAVLDDPRYREWMARFGKDCTHLLVNSETSPQRVVFRSAAMHGSRLSTIDGSVFPAPKAVQPAEPRTPRLLPQYAGRAVAGDALMKFHLKQGRDGRPGLDAAEVPLPVPLEAAAAEVRALPDLRRAVERMLARIAEASGAGPAPGAAPAPAPVSPTISPRRRAKEAGAEAMAAQLAGGSPPAPAPGPSQRPRSPPRSPRGAPVVRDCLAEEVPACLRSIGERDAELVFLGTGSALPSKLRNVSAIFLDLFERGGLLLDCGEGTYGQLVRKYGRAGTRELLKGLKLVWLSHYHADHHVGLTKILEERWLLKQRGLVPPDDVVTVVGPEQVGRFLAEYERLYPLDFDFVDCKAAAKPDHTALKQVCESLGLSQVWNVDVIHCREAYAAIIESKTGWKFVYSGDTRPCPKLIQAGKGATLLVHEATLEDEMQADAESKRHSTISEAIDVGVRMGAYRVILTHFSQRYPTVPEVDTRGLQHLALAFDLMTANFAHLPRLPLLLPPVACLFRASRREPEDEDEKGMTRFLSAP